VRVFHASKCIVDHPDVEHSRDALDFGRGFYVTTLEEQALNYANRFTRRGARAYVNEYELDEDALLELDVLKFDSYDSEWIRFVLDCRNENDNTQWDVVIGGVADDRVFTTLDLFFVGEITEEEALGRLIYIKPNDQICMRTQRALDMLLTFVEGREAS